VNVISATCYSEMVLMYCVIVCGHRHRHHRVYRNYTNTTIHSFALLFRSQSETFGEEACSVFLPVSGLLVMQHGKKSVVCVAQCVAALIPVHRTLSFLPDVYCLLLPEHSCFYNTMPVGMSMCDMPGCL